MLSNIDFTALNARFMPHFQLLFKHRLWLVTVFHAGLFAAAYVIAFSLRFDGTIPGNYFDLMLITLPIVVLVKGCLFHYYDLYRSLWSYVSLSDIRNVAEASLVSQMMLFGVNYLIEPYISRIPLSIFILDFLLITGFVGGSRLLIRRLKENRVDAAGKDRLRAMLIGPVHFVEPLIREMGHNPGESRPVIVIDPDQNMRGRRVHDILIDGNLEKLAILVDRYRVRGIILAWPEAPEDQIQRIIQESRRLQVDLKILPSMRDVLDGRYRLTDVRDVEVEDLLPRPPIFMEVEEMETFFRRRIILVTGAGGSIGSEICRQLARINPRRLVLLDRAENGLYELEVALKQRFQELKGYFLVGSVNDSSFLTSLFREYRPDVVFHAAAYKHVPLMERCPIEAAYNNILGTRILVKAAVAAGTEKLVMISTDKAVNPTNVMGVTKRIAEKYVQSQNRSGATQFLVTRFGNVLGSAGSVVPILSRQIALGGPLTVTHPEIERFFMTIPEAVQLVLQAAHIGGAGDIYVLNMGRSVKIRELAEKLVLLAGKRPGKDIKIVYTGLRPGEKLYEELFNHDEGPQSTQHPMILRAAGPKEDEAAWEAHMKEIEALVGKRDEPGLIAKFLSIVPNYQPSHEVSGEFRVP